MHKKNKYITKVKIKINKTQYQKSCLCVGPKLWSIRLSKGFHYTMQYAIGGVSCDSVFHVKMLAHPQIRLIEFSSSVAWFEGSDRGFMECLQLGECPAIRSFMWRCLHIPKFVWSSFRRVSCNLEGLTKVSWSVVRFGVWCEEARTTPNSSDWGYRRLPYVIGGTAIRSLMWILLDRVASE